jgi:hypothetical protein
MATKWDFWFENMPSGNPVSGSDHLKRFNVTLTNSRTFVAKIVSGDSFISCLKSSDGFIYLTPSLIDANVK